MAEADTSTTSGDDNQPPGYAPPDPGLGEGAESEILVGVDALEASDIPTGDEVAPADDGSDVSETVEGTDADAELEAAADAEGDAGGAADETGDDATLRTDPDAQVAADT